MKYFIHLAYKGTNYSGWQRQITNVPTVQEVLEDRLRKMLGYKVSCIGCGRTDAGVHASQFFCHIVLKETFTYDPVFRLNKMLPEDIVVFNFIPVHKEAQAQFHALDRTYEYYMHGIKNPFLSMLSSYYSKKGLVLERMQAAAELLVGVHDFSAFCKQLAIYDSTLCKISKAQIIDYKQDKLQFTITSDRFLRGMVRLIVGNLLEVGYGNLAIAVFEKALKEQLPLPYFKMAYPQGLYLAKVRYSFLDIEHS